MELPAPSWLVSVFRFVVSKRWWIVALWAALLAPSIYFALQVPQDNSLDSLIVKSDPLYITSRDFAQVFSNREYAVLFIEADDPYSPAVLARVDQLERAVGAVPGVEVNSMISVYRRAKASFTPDAEGAAALKRFASGTDIFRKQNLIGDDFLTLALLLDVQDRENRARIMRALDHVTEEFETHLGPFRRLRKVGQPYVNAYLDRDMHGASLKYFPLFGLFVVVLCLSLYRSFRALTAIVITVLLSAAYTTGYIGATGGVFSIVSILVPMTVLITCTATLVYLHSRYVDQPEGTTVEEHQLRALANKFLPCTASIFATAVGFAALVVSKIRSIRELGIWVATGLLITWFLVFTLFPSLQRILRTPTQQERKVAAGRALRALTGWLPMFTYRYRWPLVAGALLLSAGGVVALFGLPRVVSPMMLETRALEYINHGSRLYQDTKYLEQHTAGLSMTEVWLKGKAGNASDPKVVLGLKHFHEALERDPQVGMVISLPHLLRNVRYVAGEGDQLPENLAEMEKVTDQLETLLPKEPLIQRFIDAKTLSQTHLTVVSRDTDYSGVMAMEKTIRQKWQEATRRDPALGEFEMVVTGIAPLTAKISFHLVPTLVESFILSAAIIFTAFLLIFRSGPARIMAIIPSLFAILVMFIFMRGVGLGLNIATILIASTVLGSSENDQIHFFYHFLEKRKVSTEEGLKHTLLVAGRAILFATLINAGGFLAFVLADLPPIRHFGLLSAVAFGLSMLADFTALPAALWIVFREKPDSLKVALPAPSPVAAADAPPAGPA